MQFLRRWAKKNIKKMNDFTTCDLFLTSVRNFYYWFKKIFVPQESPPVKCESLELNVLSARRPCCEMLPQQQKNYCDLSLQWNIHTKVFRSRSLPAHISLNFECSLQLDWIRVHVHIIQNVRFWVFQHDEQLATFSFVCAFLKRL